MKDTRKEREWLEEFRLFVASSPCEPSPTASRALLSRVRSQLEPGVSHVFSKALLIHAFAFLVVLLFCPQLGVGPLGGGRGIMSFFVATGQLGCAALCGATLLGLSSLLTALLLRKEELRVASVYGYLYIPAISSLSFFSLMLLGGSGESASAGMWLLGAIGFGWLVLWLGAKLRWRAAALS